MLRKTLITTDEFLDLVNTQHQQWSLQRRSLNWADVFRENNFTNEMHHIDFRKISEKVWKWFLDFSCFNQFIFHDCWVGGRQFNLCTFHRTHFIQDATRYEFTNCLIEVNNSELEFSYKNQYLEYRSHGNVVINHDKSRSLVAVIFSPSHGTFYTEMLVSHLQKRDVTVLKLYDAELFGNESERKIPQHPIFSHRQYIDGIVLPGGDNIVIDPVKYTSRELLEAYLVKLSLKYKIPLLGVCRGHQFIGHHFGADIRDVHEHDEVMRIVSDPGSFLYQLAQVKMITGQEKGKDSYLHLENKTYHYKTSCNHAQAVFFKKAPDTRVTITAWSKDGVIEAMQVGGNILTFQHHHEEIQSDRFAKAVLKMFVRMVAYEPLVEAENLPERGHNNSLGY